MKFLGLGLQGKFVVALLVAAALPFLIGLAVFETSGFRYFMEERGKYHHMEAMNLADALDGEADNHGEMLQLWLTAETALMECVSRKNHEVSGMATDDLARHRRVLDELWPSLPEDHPHLLEVLHNEGAQSLMRYQDLNPEVAEVLATDANGCLLAATGKSTDFDQADENWWQQGKNLGEHERWTDILRLDASSGVFSQDVVMPLHHNGIFAGVVKISVDVTSLFTRLGTYKSHANERWQIVLENGGIVVSSEEELVPLVNHVSDQTRQAIQQKNGGWVLTQDPKGDAWLTGFAVLKSSADTHGAHILFSSPRDEVVAPLQKRFLQVGAFAIIFLAACTLAGYWMIHHQVLRPLNALGRAARSVCDTARIGPGPPPDKGAIHKQREIALRELHAICAIRTGDEIEPLAIDIAAMSERLLRYHDELEADIGTKPADHQDDLDLTRRFQAVLLPSRYPEVPPESVASPLRLRFAHFYQPALDLGGDFFDLIELDEHRAGILIADVMGHGTRSALVTGVLRALVREHTALAGEPGAFFSEINQRLHDMISRGGQTLFVTAFLVVLDTRRATATWSVAGHPAPLRVRRGSGQAPLPLWSEPHHQPALGLSAKAVYQTHESSLDVGDVFLLFTDGVFESESPEGEIFGLQRLARSLDGALEGPLATLPARIVSDVSLFRRNRIHDDDMCIVAVESASGTTPA